MILDNLRAKIKAVKLVFLHFYKCIEKVVTYQQMKNK